MERPAPRGFTALRRFHIETLAYTRPQDPYLLEHGGRRLRFKSTAEFPQDVIAGLSETELRGFPGSSHLELARVAMRTRFPRITWPGPRQGADGARVINMMALKGDVARLQTVLAAGDEAVRRYLESTMPIVARSARRVLWHDFTGDPLAGGAWTWTAEGTPPGGAPLRAGPLILAGSDLSSTPGWMEGALTSAEAVLQALP